MTVREKNGSKHGLTTIAGPAALVLAATLGLGCLMTPEGVEVERSNAALDDNRHTIIHGGAILTADPDNPLVEAMEVKGRRITRVGTAATVLALATADTEIIDLAGKAVLPGFVDSHTHVGYQHGFPAHILFIMMPPKDVLLNTIQAEIGNNPDLPLLFHGWMPTFYTGTRQELDAISDTRPIIVQALDTHGYWLNSAAIDWLGLDDCEPGADGCDLPDDGGDERDGDGNLTGIFREISWSIYINKTALERSDPDAVRGWLLFRLQSAAAVGETTIHNMSLSDSAMEFLVEFAEDGVLPVRIREYYNGEDRDARRFARSRRVRSLDRAWFDVRGPKVFIDGAPFSGTAAYIGREIFAPARIDADDLEEIIEDADDHGEQVAVHSVGHEANQIVLDAVYAAQGDCVTTSRFRVEHADVFLDADFDRIDTSLGLIFSMQPAHFPTFLPPLGDIVPPLTEYGFHRYMDAGATIVINSDETVPPAFYMAMAGIGPTPFLGPGEELSWDETLAAVTSTGAFAGHDESRLGMLKAGMLADFVIVNTDPSVLPPDALFGLQVLRTVVGGKTTFLAP